MTKPKTTTRSFNLGWWVDETVPDLTGLLAPHGIDANEFIAWLGPQLGVYRGSLSVKALMPTRGEELAAVQQLAKDLAAVMAHLAPGRIPPVAASQLLLALHKAGGNWHEMADRVHTDLVVMHWAAQHVAGKLEQRPAKRGRKANAARDALLSRVIDHVRRPGMSAPDVRSLASGILAACGVETLEEFTDDDTLKRAARRGRRAGNK